MADFDRPKAQIRQYCEKYYSLAVGQNNAADSGCITAILPPGKAMIDCLQTKPEPDATDE